MTKITQLEYLGIKEALYKAHLEGLDELEEVPDSAPCACGWISTQNAPQACQGLLKIESLLSEMIERQPEDPELENSQENSPVPLLDG